MNAWKKNLPQSEPGSGERRRTLSALRSSPPPLLKWHYCVLAAALGILANGYLLPAAICCIVLILLCSFYATKGLVLPALFLFFGAGMFWGWVQFPPAPEVPEWMSDRRKVHIAAHVAKVRSRPGNRLQIMLDQVSFQQGTTNPEPLPGTILWTWENPERWPEPGQSVHGVFRIKPVHGLRNFGTWNTELYWGAKGVQYRTYTEGPAPELRITPGANDTLRARLRGGLKPVAANSKGGAMLTALVTGERYWLDYETVELLRRSSLSHSLALSGMHLGFVVGLGFGLSWLAGRLFPNVFLHLPRPRLGILMAIPLAAGYMWLGQASPSLVRAGIMFGFWAMLLWAGRGRVLVDGLACTLALLVLVSPLLLFDLSLQFSILAVAGIGVFWPLFASRVLEPLKKFPGGKLLVPPVSILGVSIMANLALLPAMVWYFGQLSPHLYLNVLWLPLLGFLVLPLGLVGLALTVLPGMAAAGMLLLETGAATADWMVAGLAWLHQADFLDSLVMMRPKWPLMIGFWLFLIWFVVFSSARSRRSVPVLGLAVLFLGFSCIQTWTAERQDGFALTVLDVGQGQAVLLEFPEGKRILVDGGGSWNPDFDMGKAVVAPALTWGRLPRLETVVCSHPHSDHLRGLYFPLAQFQVARFASAGDLPSGRDREMLVQSLEKRDTPQDVWAAGDVYPMGQGFAIEVLHPEPGGYAGDMNNRSLVLRVVHQGKGVVLIPGDVDRKVLTDLVRSGRDIRSQVLLLPHHGSKSSLVRRFYAQVEPDLALCSAGYLNHFFFPSRKVAKALAARNIPLLTTAEQGGIRIVWNPPDWEPEITTVRNGRMQLP